MNAWRGGLWIAAALLMAAGAARARGPGAPPPAEAPPRKEADWPGSTDGLVFLWHDASRPNRVPRAGGKAPFVCRVRARGRARYYRFHDMDLAGGAFLAEDVDARLLSACRRTNQLAVEAVLTPGNVKQTGPARIVTFSRGAASRNFTLAQQGAELVFRLRTSSSGPDGTKAQPAPCRLEAGKPQHVIVTYANGTTACYLNGRQVSTGRAVRGDLGTWSADQHLLFGDEWDGGRDWAGRLEGIAIYSRFIAPAEAKRKYALYARRLAARRPARRVVLLGRLVEVTPTPTLRSIRPYRRCLAVCTYEVREVLSGRYDDKKMLVAHWVIMDRKVLDLKRRKGRTVRLTVEPFADHPQLDAERTVMVQNEWGLQRYYDVTGPPKADR